MGIFLRLSNLEQKPYWLDETYTLLRVSGYPAKDVVQDLYTGQMIHAGDFGKYQSLAAPKPAIFTITGLAQEEPQHPPLYFLLARLWSQGLGSSKLAMRGLSVIGSLLAFPAIYWLCLELFATPLVGWFAMALLATSPVMLRYAQEVRQYGLWFALLLIACALLLRSLRKPTAITWSLYTLTVIIALYCHLLTLLVMAAHGLYVLIMERFRPTRSLQTYAVSITVSLVIFSPWLWLVWRNQAVVLHTTQWARQSFPLELFLLGLGTHLSNAFWAWHLSYSPIVIYAVIPAIALIGYALYFLCRHTPPRIWLFVLLLLGTTTLPFLLADVFLGGKRSLSERYFLVVYGALYLAVAYLLACRTNPKAHPKRSKLWQLGTVLLLSSSLASCITATFSPTWWGWSEFDVEIAEIVHQVPQPLVISDMPLGSVMPIASQLHPNVAMILLDELQPEQRDRLKIPTGFSHIFLYQPTRELLKTMQAQDYEPKEVYSFQDPGTTLQVSLYQLGS
ncbi:glycosyltransferase family 39 protein [Phormidium sp. CLA17]|uniref:glycosyltransferase family 39 protein n=1 Tax=Leptolyngbya sp. Cla-17 TaxID=2803751 RepID=UPI001490BD63|nr:glycosyltransferase family 39 protein [Leptolyngbya sp. Cla-17]MBM0743531.1 glycosyltransferase family 39 protein [Leptolyngbya sp. Cla-17]